MMRYPYQLSPHQPRERRIRSLQALDQCLRCSRIGFFRA